MAVSAASLFYLNNLPARRYLSRLLNPSVWHGPAQLRPNSAMEILTSLPPAYVPHAATGLLHLPRFLAKCRYVKEHGALPASFAKNYKSQVEGAGFQLLEFGAAVCEDSRIWNPAPFLAAPFLAAAEDEPDLSKPSNSFITPV